MSAVALATASLVRVVPEAASDEAAIERVLDGAFGPGRFTKMSERVRERASQNIGLSRVARTGSALVGCCRIYDVMLGDAPALFLGPLAVEPAAQGARLSELMLADVVAACEATAESVLIVVGAQRLFGKFGFVPPPPGRVLLPGSVDPNRLLWRALKPDALNEAGGLVRGR